MDYDCLSIVSEYLDLSDRCSLVEAGLLEPSVKLIKELKHKQKYPIRMYTYDASGLADNSITIYEVKAFHSYDEFEDAFTKNFNKDIFDDSELGDAIKQMIEENKGKCKDYTLDQLNGVMKSTRFLRPAGYHNYVFFYNDEISKFSDFISSFLED